MEKRYLGVDWGKAKVGIALSFGKIAKPLGVFKSPIAEKKISELARNEGVSRIVVGISEGESEREAKKFGQKLAKVTGLPVDFWDETLTTQEAERLAKEARISRERRKMLEDAFAAAIMLESYIERD